MFITTTVTVFNPTLVGKAVALSGSLIEGNFVVVEVQKYVLKVIGRNMILHDLPIHDFEDRQIELRILGAADHAQAEPEKEKFTRGYGKKVMRKPAQIVQDNKDVESIVKRFGSTPVRLSVILESMRFMGRDHWNNNNASSFVNYAIQSNMRVHKVSQGLYAFGRRGRKSNDRKTD